VLRLLQLGFFLQWLRWRQLLFFSVLTLRTSNRPGHLRPAEALVTISGLPRLRYTAIIRTTR
jgi:hypothetical protein